MNRVFANTIALYNILFETSLTDKARRLLEDHEESELHTNLTVMNELLYISVRKCHQNKTGLKAPYSLRTLR